MMQQLWLWLVLVGQVQVQVRGDVKLALALSLSCCELVRGSNGKMDDGDYRGCHGRCMAAP